jgi:group I intron endonuclease
MSGVFYVYLWRNNVNGKCYVGKGSARRKDEHLKPSANSLLSRAFRKYGVESFTCKVLCADMEESLAFDIERSTVTHLQCKVPNGYNLTDGGEGLSGYRHTPEQRAALSASRKGKPISAEHKANISKGGKGKVLSAETRAKLSAAKTGTKFTAEHCENIRKSKLGLVASAETKAKMSAAHKARGGISPEHRKKMIDAKIGMKYTPEHCAAISAASKGRRHSEETKKKMSGPRGPYRARKKVELLP